MGSYHVAQICLNGHVATDSADRSPELREKFCSKCGEPTTMHCPSCQVPIRGYFDVPGVFGFFKYERPGYCYNCGKGFPWTERAIESAVELIEIGTELTNAEVQQLEADLRELTKDSPKTQAASFRFKRLMTKAGTAVASGVRDILIEVLSETAKKAIWGL